MLNIEETTQHVLDDRLELTAYIACVTRDYHIAEDVYQEVCVKAIARAESFDHLASWTRVTARNRAIDLIRARAGRFCGLSDQTLEVDWKKETIGSKETYFDALEKCLDSLTPRSLAILKMRYYEVRTGNEIADFIGAKVGSAYQAITRIHKTLAQCMERQIDGGGKA